MVRRCRLATQCQVIGMLSRAGWRQRTLDSIPGTWYQTTSGSAAGDWFDGQTKTE